MSSSSLHARTSIVSDADEGNTFVGDDVVHGELENQEDVKRMSLSSFHLWALGISIVVGGQYIGWNEVLLSGFGSALIATVLISSGSLRSTRVRRWIWGTYRFSSNLVVSLGEYYPISSCCAEFTADIKRGLRLDTTSQTTARYTSRMVMLPMLKRSLMGAMLGD